MFKDKVRLKIKAGHGGGGKVSFDRTMRPTGGNGGKGGDVYLVGDPGLFDLSNFKPEVEYTAKNGEPGGKNQATGASGADLVLRVPLVTIVYDEENNKLAEITASKQPVLFLQGGVGGLGNHFFRQRGREARRKYTSGRPGAEFRGRFELELKSEVIFIGLPNAGKSSLLKELTNAAAKVAPYAFTTLAPQLGQLEDITLMDLPGLIEGTAAGKGLGSGFLKHTRRTKLLAHFISLEEDITKAYQTVRSELTALDSALAAKPEIIILTKADLVDQTKIKQAQTQLSKLTSPDTKVLVTSAYDYDSLEQLKQKLLAAVRS